MVNFWWDKRGPYIRNRLYLPENLKPETLWINAAIAEKRETEIDLYGHCQVWAPVSGQGEYLWIYELKPAEYYFSANWETSCGAWMSWFKRTPAWSFLINCPYIQNFSSSFRNILLCTRSFCLGPTENWPSSRNNLTSDTLIDRTKCTTLTHSLENIPGSGLATGCPTRNRFEGSTRLHLLVLCLLFYIQQGFFLVCLVIVFIFGSDLYVNTTIQ